MATVMSQDEIRELCEGVDMNSYDFKNCVEYDGKVYYVGKDGYAHIIDVKNIDVKDIPPCVITSLFKNLAKGLSNE